MVKFIKIVSTIDVVTDCIPGLGTLKNGAIFIYQLVHKVDRVAIPIKPSWKDDLKIHFLSKNNRALLVGSIPFFSFGWIITEKIRGWILGVKSYGYFKKCFNPSYIDGPEKHQLEVLSLYLGRHPNLSKKKLSSYALLSPWVKKEALEMVLNTKQNWTPEMVVDFLSFNTNEEHIKLFLKHFSKMKLTKEDFSSILRLQANKPSLNLIVQAYPDLMPDNFNPDLYLAAEKFENFKLLFEIYNPKENELEVVFKKAAKHGYFETIKFLLEKYPNFANSHMDYLVEQAIRRSDIVCLKWLEDNKYTEKMTEHGAGKAIAEAIYKLPSAAIYFAYHKALDKNKPYSYPDSVKILAVLMEKYANLPGEYLKPAIENIYHLGQLELLLDNFKNIKAEHLQKFLNKAVFVFGSTSPHRSSYCREYDEMAKLILQRFPSMKAVHPYRVD